MGKLSLSLDEAHHSERLSQAMELNAQSKPIEIFEAWMKDAKSNPGIKEATAMALATLGPTGELHNRVVLCKDWSEAGFTFFTNYESRKGLDLAAHPGAAAVFYWDPLFKQIKISGTVQKTSRQVSEDYWKTRPRESQLSQLVSQQSREVSGRDELERAWNQAEVEFSGREIPCPSNWGGYLLIPKLIEFWIGRPGRLHDRYQFEKSVSTWTFRRLYP